MKIKLIVSDVDGVWTDGSFYYSVEGDVQRRFTTKDSYGVKICQLLSLPILILSTENSPIVQERMTKLNIDNVLLGVKNKLLALTEFCEARGILLKEVAYIGDDMNDFHLLKKVGLFACPSDAYPLIQEKADLVLTTRGGSGAFRDFIETLFKREGMLEQAYSKYKDECLRT